MRAYGWGAGGMAVLLGAQIHAQTASPADDVRISGRVEKFERGLLTLSPSQGVFLVLRFDAGPGINSVRKGRVGDLKPGVSVAVQARTNPAGGMQASQVIIYEPGAETNAGTQASTDPAQVVARLTKIETTSDGPQLVLAYKEGERKINLAKEVAVWIARPAVAQDVKPGALVTISGRKPPDSEIIVVKASIAPANSENPPL